MTEEVVIDAPGATDSGTVTVSAPPAAPQGENWERRFNGLNTAYQKLQKKYEALEAEHNSVLAEKEAMLQDGKGVKSQLEKLQADIQALTSEKESLSGQITSLQSQKERVSLVMSEFTDLAPFEAKGLLPPASTPEEMRQKFAEFRDALSSTVQQSVKDKAQGSGPVAGGGGGQPPILSKEQIYRELTQLAGARSPEDRARYEDLVKAWDKLNQ